jgi:hypothetical protein
MIGYTLMVVHFLPECCALHSFACYDFASFACYVLCFIRMLYFALFACYALLDKHVMFHCMFTHEINRENDPVMRSLTSRE